MRFISLVGCMVFIGLVDWAILWALRLGLKYAQRGVTRMMG
jgi:hypothetical protein